jgi:hypothetical protein
MTVAALPALETVHSEEMPPSSSGAPPLPDPPLLDPPELPPPFERFELLHATNTAAGTMSAARKAR